MTAAEISFMSADMAIASADGNTEHRDTTTDFHGHALAEPQGLAKTKAHHYASGCCLGDGDY